MVSLHHFKLWLDLILLLKDQLLLLNELSCNHVSLGVSVQRPPEVQLF